MYAKACRLHKMLHLPPPRPLHCLNLFVIYWLDKIEIKKLPKMQGNKVNSGQGNVNLTMRILENHWKIGKLKFLIWEKEKSSNELY